MTCVTVSPDVCAAAVVPLAPRVHPVNVFVDLPEYVIDSVPITMVPVVVKLAADVKTIDVAELLMLPLSVVVAEPDA